MTQLPEKRGSTTFFCFSPAVMFATFVIEAVIAVYLLWRYKFTRILQLSIIIIAALATFQLAEYMVCEGNADHVQFWSRLGFVAITILPVIGVHLVKEMTQSTNRWALPVAYLSGAAFVVLFSTVDVFTGHSCEGNYIIFQLSGDYGGMYFMYYYALLLGAIVWAFNEAREAKPKLRKALHLYIAGYFAFMIPTAVITVWQPHTLLGLPSIMCGFAVAFAILHGTKVIPKVVPQKGHKSRES